MAAYQRQSRACAITFLASDKTPVTLSFDDIAHRLFALSFDPYNCVELRWGGDSAACPDQMVMAGSSLPYRSGSIPGTP